VTLPEFDGFLSDLVACFTNATLLVTFYGARGKSKMKQNLLLLAMGLVAFMMVFLLTKFRNSSHEEHAGVTGRDSLPSSTGWSETDRV
jgi:hypothetical protein